MQISLDPNTENTLRSRAAAATQELEVLLQAGIDSGEPVEIGTSYWEEQHRRLRNRLKAE